MLDLGPAAAEVTRLLDGIADDDLHRPTPNPGYPVGGLIDHVLGLTLAFTAGARKSGRASAPPGGPANDPDPAWRTLLPHRLAELAAAWRDRDAWTGETTVGGVTLPAPAHAVFALDELVMHGWDLAVATGQEFHCDPASTAAVLDLTRELAEPENAGSRDGLFGPVVEVPAGASDLERALGLAGRDPTWQLP